MLSSRFCLYTWQFLANLDISQKKTPKQKNTKKNPKKPKTKTKHQPCHQKKTTSKKILLLLSLDTETRLEKEERNTFWALTLTCTEENNLTLLKFEKFTFYTKIPLATHWFSQRKKQVMVFRHSVRVKYQGKVERVNMHFFFSHHLWIIKFTPHCRIFY